MTGATGTCGHFSMCHLPWHLRLPGSSLPFKSTHRPPQRRALHRRAACNSRRMITDRSVSCTTFNILAPIYKRLTEKDQGCRESQYRSYWLSRNESIIDRLLGDRSSIICLQEVWLDNEELVNLYEKRLGDAGYVSFKLARTNNRGDEINRLLSHQQILSLSARLLTAVHREYFRNIDYQKMLFNDLGDRVAQLLHVESVVPLWQGCTSSINLQIIIVNTHLLFPHDASLCIVRLQQVYKILQYIETYQKDNNLSSIPIVLSGDWNGSKRGHVYKFLRSQGFVSSYDTAHHYTDSDADCHKWVSHRNHRGNICGVDFIWLLNPNKFRKPLRTSWKEAVFGIIKYLLHSASLSKENAFAFLKVDSPGDYITYTGFCQALRQWGLISQCDGLCHEDVKYLWAQADIEGDGVVDFEEFQRCIWSPRWSEHPDESSEEWTELESGTETRTTFGFSVKDAVLFPPEVERGMWPENYSLSDHAPLTVVFSPVKLS